MQDQYVTIQVADELVYCLQKANGTRYASMTSFTNIAGKSNNSILDFLRGKSPEALPYKGKSILENGMKSPKGNKPMTGVPFELGIAYLTKEARRNNPKASSFLRAIAQEALDVRVDAALGQHLTMSEVNDRTTLVREQLLQQYLDLQASIVDLREELGFDGDAEIQPLRQQRDTLYYQQLTLLEQEVLKERLLDSNTPGWRNGIREGIDTVTDRSGAILEGSSAVLQYQHKQHKATQAVIAV